MFTPAPRIEWPARSDLLECLKNAFLMAAAVLVLVLPTKPLGRASHATAAPAAAQVTANFNGQTASPDAQRLAHWVARSGDNRQLNFVILDKRNARVFVFDRQAQLIGTSPVLLGAAAGDDSVIGIGNRAIADVRPEERTTPAGRFDAEPGRNSGGEDVLWVDYDAAVSMHRVRATDPRERRLERLATPTPSDNRISYGCINVPVRFFEDTIVPTFKGQRGVVYVLPEVKSLPAVFPAI